VTSRPAAMTAARLLVDGDDEREALDRIMAFSRSTQSVYLHVMWFACWIGFGVERTDSAVAPAPVSPGGGPTP
jgi:hypothetical protein